MGAVVLQYMFLRLAFTSLVLALAPFTAQAFCFDEAAAKYLSGPNGNYQVSSLLLMAIAKTESNMNPRARAGNKNGTVDIGLMQINSVHLPKLAQYGISEAVLQNDACTSVQVGAWVLAQCIATHGNNWRAVGCYNTGSKGADSVRQIYVQKVKGNLDALAQKNHVQIF